ncbi:MAG: FprA family A-type flavoprotein [Alphaproteobacteria bacterium]|nr:FprA family A-type flavoprotein [Alphaproteobacteria bacterium]
MNTIEIKKDIHWVGARDWNIRNFHGYEVARGTSYNAYLIMDEKITLVDTVKEPFSNDLIDRVKSLVNLEDIDYLVCNHVEMDHSGAMPEVLKLAKNATVVTNMAASMGLKEHYNVADWKIQTVKSGDTLNIGKRNLTFVQTPMLHWPDSMVTYVAEDKLLLSNDGFGQHIATDKLFAKDNPIDIVYDEAKRYYANILYPFARQAGKALEALSGLEIEMIAPSHGCVWQGEEVAKIISLYDSWAKAEYKNKAVVIYDSMWGSTEKLARFAVEELEEQGIGTILRDVKVNHISDLISDIIDAKYVLIGSPTLNNQIMPNIAAFLCYMKGLAPHNKIGFAFGSYGWAAGAIKDIEDVFNHLKWEVPVDKYCVKYIPNGNHKEEIKEKIRELVNSN